MEALALIIGEIVFAILAPFVAIVLEVIGAVVGAIAGALGRGSGEAVASSRVARGIAIILAGLAGLMLTCVVVANYLFFDETVDFVLGQVEKRTGIVTECEEIEGSLLTGQVSLRDCDIRRGSHPRSTFELAVAEVDIDLRITSMFGTATLDSARVTGLNGWARTNRQQAQGDEARVKPRRNFEVRDLRVSDVRVSVAGTNPDGNDFEMPVAIGELEIRPLRSRFALFDVLFRANGSGTLAGAPFRISTVEIPDGRRTEWRAENVPVASFGSMVGGTLAWFSSGTVDVYIDDEWERSDATAIDLDWRLDFSGLEVAPPPGTGPVARFVTAPLTRFVNGFDGSFPLEFALVLNENQFEYRSSLSAAGVWTAVGGAVNNALSLLGFDLDSAKRTGENLKEGAKSILDRVRKPKDED